MAMKMIGVGFAIPSQQMRQSTRKGPSSVDDRQTRSMLQTNQQFPSIGSQSKGLEKNDDGSVGVYFRPKAPAGKEGNWVQTAPGKS
jgi:hypothetical protein